MALSPRLRGTLLGPATRVVPGPATLEAAAERVRLADVGIDLPQLYEHEIVAAPAHERQEGGLEPAAINQLFGSEVSTALRVRARFLVAQADPPRLARGVDALGARGLERRADDLRVV